MIDMELQIDTVQLDAIVVLKMAQHIQSQSHSNLTTSGQLLGMDVKNVVQVTNCFPIPHLEAGSSSSSSSTGANSSTAASASAQTGASAASGASTPGPIGGGAANAPTVANLITTSQNGLQWEDAQRPRTQYAAQMLNKMGQVGSDANAVGWYRNCPSGSLIFRHLLELQNSGFAHSSGGLLGNGSQRPILILNDPQQLLSTKNYIPRAYRITQKGLDAIKDGSFNSAHILASGISHLTFFQELPVKIHNPSLMSYLASYLASEDENIAQSQLNNITFGGTPKPESPSCSSISSSFPLAVENNSKRNFPDLFANLQLSGEQHLERLLDNLLDAADEFSYDMGSHHYYHRQCVRDQAKIQAWIAKRKAENQQREADNMPLLPEDDWKTIFKMPPEPSKLNHMMLAGQMSHLCKEVEKFSGPAIVKGYTFN